jgi:hypothetical protein
MSAHSAAPIRKKACLYSPERRPVSIKSAKNLPQKVPVPAATGAFPLGQSQIVGCKDEERGRMPDFEIRYFHADGTLAVIRVTSHDTREEAEAHARLHRQHHANFEVHEINRRS